MNVYAIFAEGKPTIYVRASYSFDAVAWVKRKLGWHVSAWDVATSMPATAQVWNSWE